MRFLHTADLHLGRTLDQHARMDEQQAVLAEIVALATRHEVDLVLLAGDIFDAFIPPAWAERLLYQFVEALCDQGRRAVVAIAGNHDQPERLAAAAELAAHSGIYLLGSPGQQLPAVDEILQPGLVQVAAPGQALHLQLANGERVTVAAMPYLSEARLQELFVQDIRDDLQTSRDTRAYLQSYLSQLEQEFSADTANIVLAHLFVQGGTLSDSERILPAQVGGSFAVDSAIFPAAADYIALGHLHRPQQIRAAAPCWYAGSPLAYSFSESDQTKSVLLGEISFENSTKQTTVEAIPLQAGRPLTRWHCANYEEALARCSDPGLRELWVELRIDLTAPLSSEEISALRQAHPYITAILPVYPELAEAQAAQSDAGLSILERFACFAEQNEGVAADEALLAAFSALLHEAEEDEV